MNKGYEVKMHLKIVKRMILWDIIQIYNNNNTENTLKVTALSEQFDVGVWHSRVFRLCSYLLPAAPVMAHVPLQLRAVREGVAAVRAAVVVLAGLMPILYVLL